MKSPTLRTSGSVVNWGALLAGQRFEAWRVLAVARGQLNHLALAGHHIGHAHHLGKKPVDHARRGLGFVGGAGGLALGPLRGHALR
jgi:hypothetical protein